MIDALEDVVDVVVHRSHSVEPFFCSGGEEFVVVIEVYGVWIKAIETSVGGEFVLLESYILVYKLVVMGLIAVEYIRVGRTGVNAYSIRIKL